MSEPRRLRDDGPDEVRALLREAERSRPMRPDERARSRARLARTVAGLAGGAGLLAYLQGAAIGAGLGVLAVGAAAGVPAWLAPAPSGERHAPAPTAVQRAPAPPAPVLPPSAASVSAAPAVLSPRPAPRPAPSAVEAEPPVSAAPPVPVDTLAEEAALLDKARGALGAAPGEALALTEAHAARYPAGKLTMERELVAVDALRRLGRSGEARARGEALRARGGGLYEGRIQKLLDGLR